ncbi:uncharacterized protein [Chelonus insularis]|uniref:uncharacterized protein isoform X1 n=1 Tax=Chelonus insularis TaxID=460826 RepID=UPI00158A102C|nr:uncharacterized protein LOC118064620 isoform X1 [Chelonus insularis]
MGENKSIYKHFSALPLQPNQKLKSYSCNYCKKKYAENITRMRKHLYKECRSCPQDLRKLLKPCKPRKRNNSHLNSTDDSFTIEDLNEADNRASTSMISNENLPNNISVCSNNYKKNTIDSFCDKMSKKDEDSLQELLAEAIYASGTPLCITENPYWLKFFNALRPSFNLPSRNQISNNLLDSVFVRTQNMVNEKIESATTVGVQCDAWSNIRKEGIINFIVTTPAPVFFKTFPTGTESQTALYISEKIGSVIDALGIKKVIGICTDNCAAMKSAWTLIDQKYNVDKLYCYGCAAHILNLLMKDIGSQATVETLVTSATAIVKGIKEVQIMSAIFKEIQSQDERRVFITLKLPAKTRFGSTIIMIDSLCVNKHNLQALAISSKAITLWKPASRALVLNEEFWNNLQQILQLMKPIVKWINILEGDNPLINKVPECFYDLYNHFNNAFNNIGNIFSEEEKLSIYTCLENRKTMALRPIHYAANLLDPQLKGKNLNRFNRLCVRIKYVELRLR